MSRYFFLVVTLRADIQLINASVALFWVLSLSSA